MIDILHKVTALRIVQMDGFHVTVGRAFAALLILVGSILLARLLNGVLARLRSRSHGAAASLYVVQKLITYALIAVGAMVSISSLGVNLTSLAVFAGAIGVGVGLGLQGVVKEFVSGLVLIFDRSMNIGDFIELPGGVRGLVMEIGPRATRIRTNDNVDFLVPNSNLVENQITNWTLGGVTRRIHVPFQVAYGCDKKKVRDVVLAAARGVDFTLPDTEARRTQVWMVGFGASALNFELLVWPRVEAVKQPAAIQAAYTWAIEDALRREGLEVPFSQLDLRLRSLFGVEGEAAFEALGLRAARPTAPTKRAARSVNDAAEDLLRPAPDEDVAPAPGG